MYKRQTMDMVKLVMQDNTDITLTTLVLTDTHMLEETTILNMVIETLDLLELIVRIQTLVTTEHIVTI